MSIKLTPQPGFIVVKWEEAEKELEGLVKQDSGIILKADTAERLKKDKTHMEFHILGVSKESELKVGSTIITSKKAQAIKIEIEDEVFGLMGEDEAIAQY